MVGLIISEVVSDKVLNMYNTSIYCILWCIHYCSSYNEEYISTCDTCANYYNCENTSIVKY